MKDIPWVQLSKELQHEIVEQRRKLHTIPELGFQEEKTAAYVAAKLGESGYAIREHVGKTGVIGDLGRQPVIAIRAEMDGLPIADGTSSLYSSQHAGVSHSCGHDVNMACALAAAKLLASQGNLEHGVRILMQPASEEVADDQGKTGTFRVIEDGALNGLRAIIGLHVDSTMAAGTVGIITESTRPAANNFKIEITAGPGSGSVNEKFDAVRTAALLFQSLFSSDTENEDENSSSMIINSIETATTAPEAVCQRVTLRGSLNSSNKEARREQMKRLESACDGIDMQIGTCACKVEYLESEGSGQVDAEITEIMRQVACDLVGEANVRLVKRKTWTEDFAALLKIVPGSMVLLGGQIQTSKRSHHSPTFDVDESALYVGAAILAATAHRLQNRV